MTKFFHLVFVLAVCSILVSTPNVSNAETRVVMLGTGTPIPVAGRAGASVAVVYNNTAYLFDIGSGAILRTTAASVKLGIPALNPERINHLFITHLHSDHVVDYPDLAFQRWWRRKTRLNVWGPVGLAEMSEGMYRMMAPDIRIRSGGNQPVVGKDFYRVDVHEIEIAGSDPQKRSDPAVILLEQDGLEIEAFRVDHGDIKPAYGYRITTPDKSIVISGDTTYSETLLNKARGVDILIHEVASETGISRLDEYWQTYHRSSHTTTVRLAELAGKARPKLLVLYHMLLYGTDEKGLLDEVTSRYDGAVVMANDLDVFQ